MRILIATAVNSERDAVAQGVHCSDTVHIVSVGVGPVAAAVNTSVELAKTPYNLVINMGIGGGFSAEIGTLVIANEVICADLGVETANGEFQSIEDLELGIARLSIHSSLIACITKALSASGIPTLVGPILTLSTATGTEVTTSQLSQRIPDAAAEAMEGFSVASAAQAYGVPFIEIRAVSNLVGPRDKSTWRIETALTALTQASSILEKEVFHESRLFTLP